MTDKYYGPLCVVLICYFNTFYAHASCSRQPSCFRCVSFSVFENSWCVILLLWYFLLFCTCMCHSIHNSCTVLEIHLLKDEFLFHWLDVVFKFFHVNLFYIYRWHWIRSPSLLHWGEVIRLDFVFWEPTFFLSQPVQGRVGCLVTGSHLDVSQSWVATHALFLLPLWFVEWGMLCGLGAGSMPFPDHSARVGLVGMSHGSYDELPPRRVLTSYSPAGGWQVVAWWQYLLCSHTSIHSLLWATEWTNGGYP